jgi:hypothetical protein
MTYHHISHLRPTQPNPTIYFYSSGGNLVSYEGRMTAEMIIDFIKRNKGSKPGEAAAEDDAVETDAIAEEATEAESVKDELWARRCVNTEALCFISKLKHVFYRKASLLPWLIKEMDPVGSFRTDFSGSLLSSFRLTGSDNLVICLVIILYSGNLFTVESVHCMEPVPIQALFGYVKISLDWSGLVRIKSYTSQKFTQSSSIHMAKGLTDQGLIW